MRNQCECPGLLVSTGSNRRVRTDRWIVLHALTPSFVVDKNSNFQQVSGGILNHICEHGNSYHLQI